jgi:hypothetical protein
MSKIHDEKAKRESLDRLAEAAMKSTQQDVLGQPILVQRRGEKINVGDYYQIPLDHCKNAEQLLGWISQLSEKPWMTTEMVRQLISVAESDCGISIDY